MIPVHNLFERKFISGPDYEYRVDDWYNHKTHILFILGLSGSGKTTEGQTIARKNRASYISLDKLLWKPAKEDFVKKHGDLPDKDDEFYDLIMDIVFRFRQLLPKIKKRSVMEGIWPLYSTPRDIENYSVIIKQTSVIKSTYRLVKRVNDKIENPWTSMLRRILYGTNANLYLDKRIKQFIRHFEGLK